MKIVQLRFKNLNSLRGEWEIDLTALAADGLFAITGPTGSGKTTLLDAICLALYGRTPRLPKITKSGNGIMSSRTSECFSEVTFETQAGRFRCHWSQQRARKKSHGELQAPRHEMADAASGKIFESKIKGVAHHIETATGMDFERFTRSMLLAQGGFAAFLQSPPDERAPILEQITGTAIYTEISIRIHERCTQERNRLEALEKEQAVIQLLTPQEEQQRTEHLNQQRQREAELTQQITLKQQAITWLEGIHRLEEACTALHQAFGAWQIKQDAFAPHQERLRRAQQALELTPDYVALHAIRTAQEADQNALQECQASLPRHIAAVAHAEAALQKASEQVAACKTTLQIQRPRLQQVRTLDTKIAEKHASLLAAQNSVTELSSVLAALQKKQQADSHDHDTQCKQLDALQARLKDCAVDGELVEQLTGWQHRLDGLKAVACQLASQQHEAVLAKAHYQEAVRAWQMQVERLESTRPDRDRLQTRIAEKQSAYRTLLEGHEIARWRKIQSQQLAQQARLDKILEAVESRLRAQQAHDVLESRLTMLTQEEATQIHTLTLHTAQYTTLEQEVTRLETQWLQLKRMEDLEAARHALRDGEPCPLCGATEHPFARGNVPTPHDTQQQLAAAKTALKTCADAQSEHKVQLARIQKDIEQTQSAQKELTEKMQEADRIIRTHSAELNAPESPLVKPCMNATDLAETLNALRKDNADALQRTTAVLETAETLEKELATLRQNLETLRDTVTQREHEVQAATLQKASAEQRLTQIQAHVATLQAQQQHLQDGLQKEIARFGIPTLTVETLEPAYAQLVARRDQWVSYMQQKSALEQAIASLAIQRVHQAAQIQRVETDLAKQQAHCITLQREQAALWQQRRDLLGERMPDDEEQRLIAACESSEKEQSLAQQACATVRQEHHHLNARMDDLVNAMNTRAAALQSATEALQARLTAAGFTDEAHYRSACLSENERQQLALQAQQLSDEGKELQVKMREKTHLLEAQRQQRITDASLADLQHDVAALATLQRQVVEQIARLQQQLADNEYQKQQHREKTQSLKAQQRECERWNLLHELIGSSDGKKYRNFVQGLTFERLIGYANQQLRKMTDRYLLIRDNTQPLELNVIDHYQGGETRSTKNLSGGESFIVSLALALGLSQMTSRNVRVDSLFLDEGFGTLDEEALGTALDTLATLQQDGKLIGIISHVAAIKERISTQIQVIPQAGGRSHIVGMGCRQIS